MLHDFCKKIGLISKISPKVDDYEVAQSCGSHLFYFGRFFVQKDALGGSGAVQTDYSVVLNVDGRDVGEDTAQGIFGSHVVASHLGHGTVAELD